ncbi:type II toxin-antitoxin system HipA family toxin [Acidithiobacillus sp. IBUN Pt1247-S3]|uniref:type II toxin-antitoxin system HipA family toxin n=1 Tax=Acidithiobacillus sp. IBUN Pt1247-S3 TaxID=3166642 RepID=UPI0034E5525C
MTSKVKELLVHTPQGYAGLLAKESRYAFTYDRGALLASEVSLVMPFRAESYAGSVMPAIFAMNRPEGWLEQELLRRMARHGPVDEMRLLSLTGEHQIGRLSFSRPEGEERKTPQRIALREILQGHSSAEVFAFLVDQYLESGISGVQPKVLVPDAENSRYTGQLPDLIVKSGGDEYPGLAVNEFLCLSVARKSGLATPVFHLSEDQNLLVLERFDLSGDGDSTFRMGFEDLSVLLGKTADPYGAYKYQGSYELIAKTVGLLCGVHAKESLAEFFASVALSVMVRNGDAHLKNFGLLYDHPHGEPPRLAPVYDVITTTVYPYWNHRTGMEMVDRTLALKMGKRKGYPSRQELLDFGRNYCQVEHPETVLEKLADSMDFVLRESSAMLPSSLRDSFRAEWESGMRMSLRNRFSSIASDAVGFLEDTQAEESFPAPAHRREDGCL